MEYLKFILTYAIVTIVFNIPRLIKWVKNKDSYYLNLLKKNAKMHTAILFGRLSGTIIADIFLKIDIEVFNMSKELAVAISMNIIFAFTNLFSETSSRL